MKNNQRKISFGFSIIIACLCISQATLAHTVDTDLSASHEQIDQIVPMTAKQETALVQQIESQRIGMASPSITLAAATSSSYDIIGKWDAAMNWPLVPIFVSLLNDGRVIAYDSATDNSVDLTNIHNTTRVAIWDPVSNVIKRADVNTGYELFCSGFSKLPDGRLFAAGGNINAALGGLNKTHIFDPILDHWSLEATMAAPRWYPSVTPLNNGEMLITGGGPATSEVRQINGTLRALTSASQSLWAVREYPWLQTAPNGKVFYYGPQNALGYISTNGAGSWQSMGGRDGQYRSYGSTAMYDIGKLLVTGGNGNNASAFTIDINGQTPIVQPTSSMANGRTQHNVTVLADGSVLATGGNRTGALVDLANGIYAAELWNPATNLWSTLSSMVYTRQYHSFALLLPDARVLVGGGGICGSCESQGYHYMNTEIFSPPYLFKRDSSNQAAPRPVITTAPNGINFSQAFSISTDSGVTIKKVALARPGSVTHSINMEQRYIPLTFIQSGTNLLVTAPANANIAPPGRYMLFILDDTGTPSIAKFVDIGANAARPAMEQNWAQIPGTMHQVSVNTAGQAVAVDDAGATFQWQTNNWEQLTGQFNQVSISADGIIWAINPSGAIFRRDSTNWTTISGKLNQISAARNGIAWGVTATNTIWRWKNGWTQISGSLKQVSAGPNGTAWGVTTANQVYFWNGSNWSLRTGSMLEVSVGDDGAVWGIGLDHTIWTWDGTNWIQKPGSLVTLSVGNASTVWGVDADGKVWRWQGERPTVTSMTSQPKPSGSSITYTASATGNSNLMYKWDFGDSVPETAWSASPTISHTFSQPRRYIVRLTLRTATGAETSTEFVQAIHAPHTANRPSVSMNVLYEERSIGDRIWNINSDNDSISVINASNNSKITEISVGRSPSSVARSANGRIWVVNRNDSTISIIDPNTLSVVQTLSLRASSQPFGISFSPDGTYAYVTLEATGQLVKLDAASGANAGTVSVGTNPRHLSINSNGSLAYISRFISPPLPGEGTANPITTAGGGKIVVVNTTTMVIANTINLKVSDRPDSATGGRGIPNYLGPAVISPDGLTAWIPSKQDNVQRGMLRDGLNLNHENSVRAIASRINLSLGQEDYSSRIDLDNTGLATTALYDRSGSYLFIALENTQMVAVIDPCDMTELGRINVGRAPQGLAISKDGLRLYVSNFMDRSLDIYDLSALINRGEFTINKLATVNSVTTERLSSIVLRGKQLFYDAQDTRLARDGYLSCTACHNNGGQDGRVWDLTGFGEGLRNTIDLNGRAGMAHGLLHWSANFDEVQDFEGQIRNLAGGTGLMSEADFNTTQATLGSPKAGKSSDLDALAAYVNSLSKFSPSPLRNSDGSLTADAVAGKTLFISSGCVQCHSGEGFTDSPLGTSHNVGTIKTSSGKRLNSSLTALDTPTLRDVWNTAPYLHDGSASTIGAAISTHTDITISTTQIAQVAAYVEQIGGTEPKIIPNVPPNVGITSPSSASTVSGNSVIIYADAIDADGIAGVQFKLDGINLGLEDNSAPYTVNWNSSTTTNGSHSLTAVARDSLGATVTSAAITVNVSNVGLPDTVVTSLSYANGLFTSTIKNQGTAATPTGIWVGVGYYVDGVYKTYGVPVRNLAAGASANISANITPYIIANGTHTIKAVVDDVNRFAELSDSNNGLEQTIVVGGGDSTPPTVSISNPIAGATVSGSAITLSANASDNVEVAGVQFKLDGINLGSEDTSAPYSIIWNSLTAPSGSHTLAAVARDTAGNTTSSTVITVNVNNTTTSLPDVVVTSVSYANGIFTSTIKNQGLAATPTGVWIGVGYYVDGIYKTYGMPVRNLAAGSSINIAENATPYTVPSGTHTVTAFVDDVNRFAESDEANNKRSISINAP
jgi:YVTN family beta-propeller protein